MFIPIMDWDDLEEEPKIQTKEKNACNSTHCGCGMDSYGKKNGGCICIDCKCHLRRTRSNSNNLLTNPMFLYGCISMSMITILYLLQK